MNKPIPWPKLAAVAFSAAMMIGYVVFRTAYAQEGGADSRVLPSSKSGRVVPQQEPAQALAGSTITKQSSKPFQADPASTTQITIQSSGFVISPGSVLPGSKSTAVILPSDVNVFREGNAATTQLTGPPGGRPPGIPTTHFSLEPQQRQQR
jgi:hypothetical protein